MEFIDAFNSSVYVPNITALLEVESVLIETKVFTESEQSRIMAALNSASSHLKLSIGIKKLLYIIEMASQDVDKVDKFIATILEENARV